MWQKCVGVDVRDVRSWQHVDERETRRTCRWDRRALCARGRPARRADAAPRHIPDSFASETPLINRLSLLIPAFIVSCSSGSSPGGADSAVGTTTTTPPPAAPAPTPASYCATLQPYIDTAAQQAGFQSTLKCFDLPDLRTSAHIGTSDIPTERRLATCFQNADEAKKIFDDGGSMQFSYTYSKDASVGAGAKVDLSFLGKWAPAISLSGANTNTVKVSISFTDVHRRSVSDLATTLCRSTSSMAPDCIKYLNRDDVRYVPISLVGKIKIDIQVASGAEVKLDASFADLVTLNAKYGSPEKSHLQLSSTDVVTIAGSIQASKKSMGDVTGPCSAYFPDRDSDGFGDASAAAIFSSSSPQGYVANATDCYDNNASAKPGQGAFFETNRGDGSFDYDCDGTIQQQWTELERGCFQTGNLVGHCQANQGWVGSVASCGEARNWLDDCDRETHNIKIAHCSRREESPRRQRCR